MDVINEAMPILLDSMDELNSTPRRTKSFIAPIVL